MAVRSIGVDLRPTEVRVVQLLCSGRRVRLENACARAIGGQAPAQDDTDKGSAAIALNSLVVEEGLRARTGAVGIPSDAVFFERHRTDLPQEDQVRQVLYFELEDEFPLPVEDMVLDICSARKLPEGGLSLLVGAAARSALREGAQALTDAGLACDLVDAEVCAVHAVIAENHPEVAQGPFVMAYVRGRRLILGVADEGSLLSARAFPVSKGPEPDGALEELASTAAREIEMTWRDLFGGSMPPATALALGGESEQLDRLAALLEERLGCAVTLLEPFARIARPDEQEASSEFTIALGLALRAADRGAGGMNFLAADRFKANKAAALKRGLVVFAILAALLAVSWLLGLLLHLQRLEREDRRVTAEINKIFRETLPEEPNIVDPLLQLQTHLKALRAEYDSFASAAPDAQSPLRILQLISAGAPANIKVTISELSIRGRSVLLKGAADSLKSADAFKRAMQTVAEFGAIEITDINMDRGNPRFTMAITLSHT